MDLRISILGLNNFLNLFEFLRYYIFIILWYLNYPLSQESVQKLEDERTFKIPLQASFFIHI